MKEDIIKMAREVDMPYEYDTGRIIHLKQLERFAALVLAKHPPQSSMAWQEGFEAGRLAEREACAKVCEAHVGIWIIPAGPKECAAAIRARGKKSD